MNKWVFGTAATGTKGATNAAATINRLKDVLGSGHPAVKGIRQDFLFDTPPNFKKFIKNFENIENMHPSIKRAMNLNETSLRQMRNFARAADKIAPSAGHSFDFARSLSQFFFGHQIARKGLIVRTATFPMRMLMNIIKGATGNTKRAMISDLAGAAYGTPMITKTSAAGGRILAGAFWANPQRIGEQIDEKKLGQQE
jgi:hypothetical protein